MTSIVIKHRVRAGDSLHAIARRYNVAVEVLVLNNGISDINRISIGQVLEIPRERQLLPDLLGKKARTHRVFAGETLSKIAQSHNVTMDALLHANGIHDPNCIRIGQVLTIPQVGRLDSRPSIPEVLNERTSRLQTPPLQSSPESPALKTNSYKTGKEVSSFGRVRNAEGLELRDNPTPIGAIEKRLPFNARVFVSHELPGDWYFVTLDDGCFGYVYAKHISIHPPEPEAILHKIRPNESALVIVRQYYKIEPNEGLRGAVKQLYTGGPFHWRQDWGQDERYYANVLVEANRNAYPSGIYKPDANSDWSQIRTREGYLIWVPSRAFAKIMRGRVQSGSISYESWQAAKLAAETVGDYVLGHAAFSAGVVHGILESIWDLLTGIVDLVELIWKILKSFITGSFLSDLGELWGFVERIEIRGLIEVGLEAFRSRWYDDDFLKRWHFRGWVVGYAIAEIVMAVVSGAESLVKWAGKAGRFSKLIAKFPKILRLAEEVTTATKGVKAAAKERLLKSIAHASERLPDSAMKKLATGGRAGNRIKEKKVISIASGVAEDPGRLMRGAKLGERLERFLSEITKGAGLMKVDKRLVTATDLAALTRHTGREFALVVLEDSTRVLVDMGSYKGGQLPVNTKLLLMHSHPYDYGTGTAKWISEADVSALKHLQQKHSYMVTIDGTVYKFTPNTPINSIGEAVREPHPFHGWINPKSRVDP